MIAARKGNNTGAPCCSAGNLDRVLDSLGTCGDQQRLFGRITGGQRVQLLGQLDVGTIRHNLKRGVRIVVFLRLGGSDNLGMTVTGVQHTNAADKVDITVAFNVPQLGVFRVFGIDGCGRCDTPCNSGIAACDHLRVTDIGCGNSV